MKRLIIALILVLSAAPVFAESLSWEPVFGATGYNIYGARNPLTVQDNLIDTTTETTFELTEGTHENWYFAIQAFDDLGNTSDMSVLVQWVDSQPTVIVIRIPKMLRTTYGMGVLRTSYGAGITR